MTTLLLPSAAQRSSAQEPTPPAPPATSTELSRESKDLQHGIFTSALLEALGGKADANGDGYISLSELRGYLGTRVQALSGNRQHPTVRVPGEKDWEARIALAQR